MTRVCVVTTVKHPGVALKRWLDYHTRVGVAHFFIFFDDPLDPDCAAITDDPRVTAIPCTDEVRRQQRLLPVYAYAGPLIDEISGRQLLNVDLAITLALAAGFDWLLHIDVDEAIYLPSLALPELLGRLPDSIEAYLFTNHEAAPATRHVDNWLTEVTAFKVNPQLLGDLDFEPLLSQDHQKYFFTAYSNGKSGVRLRPGVQASGAHRFHRGQKLLPTATDDRAAVLLHFVNCGFQQFVDKYRVHGYFPDRYLGLTPLLGFHREARDAFHSLGAFGLEELYRRYVLYDEPLELERLFAAGVLRTFIL